MQGATIALLPPAIHGEIHGALHTVTTDSDGKYQIGDVKDGSYEIVASAKGFAPFIYQRDSSVNGVFQKVNASTVLRGIDFQLVPEPDGP